MLPSCLNSFLAQAGCKDNTDVSCYCKLAPYAQQIIGCVQAYGQDNAEIQKALSYFAGICVQQIPQNPAIITAVPPSITLAPPAPVTSAAAQAAAPPAPSTVVTLNTPVVQGSITTTISVQVTLPQVGFGTTTAPGAAPSVGLVPGPPAVPASPTGPAAPGVTTSAAAAAGVPGAPGATGVYTPPPPGASGSPIATAAAAGIFAPGVGSLGAIAAAFMLL